MSVRRTLAATLLTLALMPRAAAADTLLVPFWGVNFGGDSGKNFSDSFDASRFAYGLGFAFMGKGVIGLDTDIAFSPDFFGKTDLGGSSVFTATTNVMVGVPFGGQQGFGVRPYGVIGIGLMRSSAEFDGVSQNSVTWDFGGGLAIFFSNRFGLRADFRYFRTFDDVEIFGVEVIEDQPGKLDFTRTSVGFIVRF